MKQLLALTTLILITGCANRATKSTLHDEYRQSIYESAVFNSTHIRPLKAVPGDTVTVLTWTSRESAGKYYPLGKSSLGIDLWVTLVPEVKEQCLAFNDDSLNLRMQQLLGLPPKTEDRMFVEMRIAKRDLFRPCYNPDITELQCGNEFQDTTSEKYKAWIADQFSSRYSVNGYPWTRLGYTYDWNSETDIYGASEFIAKKGSEIEVIQHYETGSYCE